MEHYLIYDPIRGGHYDQSKMVLSHGFVNISEGVTGTLITLNEEARDNLQARPGDKLEWVGNGVLMNHSHQERMAELRQKVNAEFQNYAW